MRHYGDITKLPGCVLPIVDVITGGSPCQDLSVAGKRAGLAGERSGLFMGQMRIVKEMRERDVRDGRPAQYVRPRYMVWENVPGAFSSGSPKGSDFQAVLEEIVRVVCKEAPPVPLPKEGWPKAGCISGVGDSGCTFSIAWRVHDAQFWGVPQRRKRIALVADFGGLSAPEILFERKGLSGDSKPGAETGERTAGATGSGVEGASVKAYGISAYESNAMKSPNPHSGIYEADTARTLDLNGGSPACNQGGVAIVQGSYIPDVAHALSARHDVSPQPDKGNGANIVCAGFKGGNGAKASGIGYEEEVSPTLSAAESGTNQTPCVYDAREPLPFDTTQITSPQNGNNPHYGDPCHPLAAGAHPSAVAIGNGQLNQVSMAEQCNTLDTMHDQQAVLTYAPDVAKSLHAKANCQFREGSETYVAAADCRNGVENGEINGTLQAKEQGQNLNSNNVCRCGSVVRRLTPLECERLQGYPDGWTDIGEWTDSKGKKHKDADSPRYKALGNSIALPFWQCLARRIVAQYERDVTMASLFDGIGGFPLVFSRCGAVPVWASEIEEFPIAVTKKHFPEE